MGEATVWIVIAGVAIPVGWGVAVFNRVNSLRHLILNSWAGIDVELTRRYDLIPNLVEVVKGYAAHEKDLLERLAMARERASKNHGAVASQVADEREMVFAANTVLARAEAYPDLKASEHFLRLQAELALTEDRIAAARRFYNGNVRALNALRMTFPASVVTAMMGVAPAEYFEVDALAVRSAPAVDLAR